MIFFDLKDNEKLVRGSRKNLRKENIVSDGNSKWENLIGRESIRNKNSFTVPYKEIRNSNYVLGIEMYTEIEYQSVDFDPPEKILSQIKDLYNEIGSDLTKLTKEIK